MNATEVGSSGYAGSQRGPYLGFPCAECGRQRLLHDYPRSHRIECEKCKAAWDGEDNAALAHREAGRREGRAMAYESAAAMVSVIYDAAQCGEVVKALWNLARDEKAEKQEAGE